MLAIFANITVRADQRCRVIAKPGHHIAFGNPNYNVHAVCARHLLDRGRCFARHGVEIRRDHREIVENVPGCGLLRQHGETHTLFRYLFQASHYSIDVAVKITPCGVERDRGGLEAQV